MIYALWHGGAGYSYGELPRDLEHFASIRRAEEALRDRYEWRGPHLFNYTNRLQESAETPAVDLTSSMTIYRYNPTDERDPYPDLLLEFGPRGGVRRVTT